MKPKAIIFTGYGLNCEEETHFALKLAGAKPEYIHINDLIENPNKLSQFQIAAIPGGFSFGDDTGSGNAYANKIHNHLWENLVDFTHKDKLLIGICNGFQILVYLGLLPALDGQYGKKQVALNWNRGARLLCRWVDLKTEKNNNPWLRGIKKLSLPIAHGEGNFYAPAEILNKLKKNQQIALKYFKGEMCKYQNLEPNPNGAQEAIAGITNPTGKILGLMPHPERAIFFHHLPNWPLLKEKLIRLNKKVPPFGPGLQVFKNAVNYFK